MSGTDAYLQGSEVDYLANFNSIASHSYSAVDEEAQVELRLQCSNDIEIDPSSIVTLDSLTNDVTITASEASSQCSPTTICVLPVGLTLRMTSSLNVGALIVRGTLWWDTNTMEDGWLCAGYVAVEGDGHFYLNLSDAGTTTAWIYLKDNGATHDILRTRAFGAVSGTVDIRGREMTRTWSLLARPLSTGETNLQLMHDPVSMGWKVGDRIAVAPTEVKSSGTGQSFKIQGMEENNVIRLETASLYDYRANFLSGNSLLGLQSAEVVNLSRNVVITGDDFTHVPCENGLPEAIPGEQSSVFGCRCASYRSTCTVGSHVVHMFSGVQRIQNTRVERCGQRGVEGKYCLHLHQLGSCPDCLLRNNAIENSQGRGIIVHGTHLSHVSHNVLYDVRGAGLYLEDGNEMYNTLDYNVVICPWPLKHPTLQGCTVPGTSNDQSDTELNQSGIYSLTPSFHCIGNRVSNAFNGMLVEAGRGRGAAHNNVCTSNYPMGRFEGNTFHSGGRFGTYFLNNNFPKSSVDASVNSNGFASSGSCEGFTISGKDVGLPTALSHHFDYGNAFVGHYNGGDIQYKDHMSVESNNLLYWKESKNFSDGCSSFLKGGYYRDGNVALPDQGTMILENMVFDGVSLEANHHCNVGITGVLCMPQYILENVEWTGKSGKWVIFQAGNFQGHAANQNYGGIFSSSPGTSTIGSSFFPQGYVSLVSDKFGYLLQFDVCRHSTNDLGLGERYDGGVLCRRPLRALKIYTRGLVSGTAPPLLLEIWVDNNEMQSATIPFHQTGGDRETDKQGYSIPVLLDPSYFYRLSLKGGDIPSDWILEFSDLVLGNRYDAIDSIHLRVAGRDCGGGLNEFGDVTSQHDRRYIWADSEYHLGSDAWGRGACNGYEDEDPVDCNVVPDLEATSCPNQCTSACPSNSYCACGSPNMCVCHPGFTGPSCEKSLCASARCATRGTCSATFLGSTIPVSQRACVCDESSGGSMYGGPLCDLNPCKDISCSNHGSCIPNGDSDWTCRCQEGYSGNECETTCDGFCQGNYPYDCATQLGGNIVSYWCNSSGGCNYSEAHDINNSDGLCRYKSVGSALCTCSSPNDCQITGKCGEDGKCPVPTNRVNETPCNSKPDGICVDGVCVLPLPTPTPIPSFQPSSSPIIPTPTDKPSLYPTKSPTLSSTSKPSEKIDAGSCEGFCKGTFPFGCAESLPNKNIYRCGPNRGCHYATSMSDEYPSRFCIFKVNGTPTSQPQSPTSSPLDTSIPSSLVQSSSSPTENKEDASQSPSELYDTKSPSFLPTLKPSEMPVKDPTATPTSSPNKRPVKDPTATPTSSPNNDTRSPVALSNNGWFMDAATVSFKAKDEMVVRHRVGAAAHDATVTLYRYDCVTKVGDGGVVSISSKVELSEVEPAVSVATFNLKLDPAADNGDGLLVGDDKLRFCSVLELLRAEDGMSIAFRKTKFELTLDMSAGFFVVNVNSNEGNIEVVEEDLSMYEIEACLCQQSFSCADPNKMVEQGSSVGICLMTSSPGVIVSDFHLSMTANGFTYVPVAKDGTPDSTTTIENDGTGKVTKINARLVTALFQGPSDVVVISGAGSLDFVAGRQRSTPDGTTKEFVSYVGTYSAVQQPTTSMFVRVLNWIMDTILFWLHLP